MRMYMHHQQENNLELLVSYANYDNYIKALTWSTHQWLNKIKVNRSQIAPASMSTLPVAGSFTHKQDNEERHSYHKTCRRSPSEDHHYSNRRSPLPMQHRSPLWSPYARRWYQQSPSPHLHNHPLYRHSKSPVHHPHNSSQESSKRKSVPRERSPPHTLTPVNPESLSIPPLPMFSGIPTGIGLPPNTPLPYRANIAFMWSPSGNTLSPVLLQSNMMIIPFPLPSSIPTLSALLPWPVAAALPVPSPSITMGIHDSSSSSLASRITTMAEMQPLSTSPTTSPPTLMSQMTDHLSARLSNPSPSLTLSERLSDSNRLTLADHLEVTDYMEIDQMLETQPTRNFNFLSGQSTSSMIGVNAPYQSPTWGESVCTQDISDEEAMDNNEEGELSYKKTKRGHCSGHMIQGYRRHNEEWEERRQRRQGWC